MGNITISQRRMRGFKAPVALLYMSLSLSYGQVRPLTSSQKAHKIAGEVLLGAMPALALSSTSIWKDGQKGTYPFSKALAGTIALTIRTTHKKS